MIKVSLIIPNLNGLVYLKRSLPLIFNLTYQSLEIIVIDNGSTDESVEFLSSINNKSFNFIESPVFHSKNFACNYAVKKATGEYILMLDNDVLINDVYIIQKLLDRYRELSKKTKVGLIGLSFIDLGKKNSKSYGTKLGLYFIKEQKPLSIKKISRFDGGHTAFPEGKGFLIKKSTWLRVGGYDEHLTYGGDDTDLGMRLWLFGYENFLYAKDTFLHIGTPERDDNQKFAKKWELIFYAHMYTIAKNYSKNSVFPTLIGYSIFGLLKSFKQSFMRRDLRPIYSYFKGGYLFLLNIRVALKKRKDLRLNFNLKENSFVKLSGN